MASEPPPSSVPESSFPLLLSPLSPRRQDDPRVTGVTRSSTTAAGSTPGTSAVGGVFTFMMQAASFPFPAALPLCSATGGLDAAASTLSSPFGGMAAMGAPAPFLAPPLLTTGEPSLVPPLMAGLGAATAGPSFPTVLPSLVVAPRAGSSPILAAVGWPATTDVVAVDAALAAALATAKTALAWESAR
ncbi:hypothetical protein GUJ93_ZPchr0010g10757 [Zizania palustris]|uniref:Uncharacterized protein n=1 Tax=Zizania palustris TaxID=103762 RepID=A0A8J5SZC1_ZIZPA|nr:hypothetical protein GUJ93_ZPchr0010g10757 [Zizania palustris]